MHHPRKKALSATPRWLRPKMSREQIRDLGLAHVTNVDVIFKGKADEGILWDLVHCVHVWTVVASEMGLGVPEMAEQVDLVTRLIKRYGDTGHICFDANDYETAKTGICVMDALAEKADQYTAELANQAALKVVDALSAQCNRIKAAAAA